VTLALPVFEDRVSAIFDNCTQLLLVNFAGGKYISRRKLYMKSNNLPRMLEILKTEGVQVVICGAISRCMQRAVEANGIYVISWISGSVSDVLDAYAKGTLGNYVMPGCGHFYRNKDWLKKKLKKEDEIMPRFDGTGTGGGRSGTGAGGSKMGQGRGGGRFSLGPGGNCVCPQCGTTVPHKRQVPCTSLKCPQCGSYMIRQR